MFVGQQINFEFIACASCKTLQYLNLAANRAEKMKGLDSMVEKSSIVHLSLAWNGIKGDTIKHLCTGLVSNTTLAHIDLKGNAIADDSVEEFVDICYLEIRINLHPLSYRSICPLTVSVRGSAQVITKLMPQLHLVNLNETVLGIDGGSFWRSCVASNLKVSMKGSKIMVDASQHSLWPFCVKDEISNSQVQSRFSTSLQDSAKSEIISMNEAHFGHLQFFADLNSRWTYDQRGCPACQTHSSSQWLTCMQARRLLDLCHGSAEGMLQLFVYSLWTRNVSCPIVTVLIPLMKYCRQEACHC